jgi:MSHA biogenesis protein MshJ
MNLEKWYQIREKTADLSLRERGIIAGAAVVLVCFIWLQTSYLAYEKQHKLNVSQKSSLSKDSVKQSERLAELTAALQHDPNAALRNEQATLKNSLQKLRLKIENRMSNLVAPEDMASLMKQVLSDYQGLTLLSARNLPVEPLNINDSVSSAQSENTDGPQAVIFTHGFEMELSGSYFQTVQYLQQLENLSGFYWRMLDYQVDQYPKAIIRIQLSTLSLEEDWIGV